MSLGRPRCILKSYVNVATTRCSIAIETGRVPTDQLLCGSAAADTTQVRGLYQDLRVRAAPRRHRLRAGRVAPRRAQPGRHDRHHAKFLQPQQLRESEHTRDMNINCWIWLCMTDAFDIDRVEVAW